MGFDERKIPDTPMDYIRRAAVWAVEKNGDSPGWVAVVLGLSHSCIYKQLASQRGFGGTAVAVKPVRKHSRHPLERAGQVCATLTQTAGYDRRHCHSYNGESTRSSSFFILIFYLAQTQYTVGLMYEFHFSDP